MCDRYCNNEACNYDNGDCPRQCSAGCPSSWIGDGECDNPCNSKDCNFDGGDCTPGSTGGATNFNIRVFTNVTDPDQKRSIDAAVRKIAAVFTAGHTTPFSTTSSHVNRYCNPGPTSYSTSALSTADLSLFIIARPIDGPFGTLGSAASCSYDSSSMPRVGFMNLDTADMEREQSEGALQSTIMHEIGHILGLNGNFYTHQNVAQNTAVSDSGTPEYTGSGGKSAYAALGASGNVPLDNTGRRGTHGSHWHETRFGHELMTGFLSGPAQPMSRLTLMALRDLGYQVDLSKAEPYSLPVPSSDSRGSELKDEQDTWLTEGEPEELVPIGVSDSSGPTAPPVHEGLSTGAKAGIAVGAIAGVGLLVAGGVFIGKTKASGKVHHQSQEGPVPGT
jgi:hypothetical protein